MRLMLSMKLDIEELGKRLLVSSERAMAQRCASFPINKKSLNGTTRAPFKVCNLKDEWDLD